MMRSFSAFLSGCVLVLGSAACVGSLQAREMADQSRGAQSPQHSAASQYQQQSSRANSTSASTARTSQGSASASSSGKSSAAGKQRYVSASSLNVRSGPSSSRKVLRSVKRGEQVRVYATQDGWSRISADGQAEAWVSSRLLKDQR